MWNSFFKRVGISRLFTSLLAMPCTSRRVELSQNRYADTSPHTNFGMAFRCVVPTLCLGRAKSSLRIQKPSLGNSRNNAKVGVRASRRVNVRWRVTGFTIVEVLVAVTLLTAVIAGTLWTSAEALKLSGYARSQITAIYLAQEPIEYIRGVRDSNIIQGNDWLQDLDECENSDCIIDVRLDVSDPDAVQACSDACENIKFNQSSGLYGYGDGGDWIDTGYVRSVRINKPATESSITDDEAAIDVTISWQGKVGARTFSLRDNIYNR